MNLAPFFEPEHIVVIGASSNPGRVGGRPITFLQRLAYAGTISPVNPKRDHIAGLPCWPSVADVPGQPDLALIAVAGDAAIAAVEACGLRGIGAAIVFTAGFVEQDEHGRELEARLLATAQRYGLRVCGPNTLGIISEPRKVAATFATSLDRTDRLEPGRIGLISQSGALGAFMHREAQLQGVPLRHFVATGNESDLTSGDYLRFMVEEEEIRAVGLYLEGIRDGESLIEGLRRARELRKPVLVVKVGRGDRAKTAAQSHTGALSGEDAVIDAVLRQYGALRVRDIDGLLALLYLVSEAATLPAGNRLGVVSLSGGLGVWAADVIEEQGAAVADLTEPTRAALRGLLPAFASITNPVDVTGQIVNQPALLAQAISIVAEDPGVDTVLVGMGIQDALGTEIADGIARAVAATDVLVVTAWMAGPEAAYERLAQEGVPTFRSVGRALEAATGLAAWAGFLQAWLARPDDRRARGKITVTASPETEPTEFAAKQLLSAVGIAVPPGAVVQESEEAAAVVSELRRPVVMKVQIPGVAHKTDLGLVELRITSPEQAASCFSRLRQRVVELQLVDETTPVSVLVEEMMDGVIELILGYRRDLIFGPIVVLGIGGTRTELSQSVAHRRAPFDHADVRWLLEQSRVATLLDGFRGADVIDSSPLAEAVLAFSDLVDTHQDRFEEIEINPLAVSKRDKQVFALDALMVPRERPTTPYNERTILR